MSAPCLPFASHSNKKRRRNVDSKEVISKNDTSDAGNHDDDEDDVENDVGLEDIATMDAAEYLSRVVHQAKKLPEFFVASGAVTLSNKDALIPEKYRQFGPIDGSAASLSYLFSSRASLTRPPSKEYVPHHPNEWTETSLANFERLRLYLERCREQGVGGKLTERVAFPPMKDRAGWHLFCVGSEEADGNMKSYFGDDYDEVKMTSGDNKEEEEEETSLPEWRRNIPKEGYSATVTVVSQMDQVLVRQVLSHLCHYVVQGWKLTAQRALWIYALLARLEKPVQRDDASTLFGLLKVLTRARSTLKISVEGRIELSRLNILIIILGVYFEQGASIVMSVLDQE